MYVGVVPSRTLMIGVAVVVVAAVTTPDGVKVCLFAATAAVISAVCIFEILD